MTEKFDEWGHELKEAAKDAEFTLWLEELDKVHRKYSAHDGSYTESTGDECWREYFGDGYTPEEAYTEDCSNVLN